jgi:hypothetical protein
VLGKIQELLMPVPDKAAKPNIHKEYTNRSACCQYKYTYNNPYYLRACLLNGL